MKRRLGIGIVMALLGMAGMASAQQEPNFEALLQDKNEVLKTEMEGAVQGDHKVFTVVTDDDITAVRVGDIYKSNASFFKVTRINSQGSRGGEFLVERAYGAAEPGQKWNRVSGLGPLTVVSRMTLWDWFRAGGFLMYVIAGVLFLVLLIVLNAIWIYWPWMHCYGDFVGKVRGAVADGDLHRFRDLAARKWGLFGAVCRAMVQNFNTSTVEDMKDRCEAVALRVISLLRIPLRMLTWSAAVAPLLGLLGTVIGIIMCFAALEMEQASAAKAQGLAAGIKVALLTTAWGLIVAIFAMFWYLLFHLMLNWIIGRSEVLADEFVHELATMKRRAVIAARARTQTGQPVAAGAAAPEA